MSCERSILELMDAGDEFKIISGITRKTDGQVTNILKYHVENGNRAPGSTTAYSTSADVSITTLYAANKFTILVGTVKIKDLTGITNGTIKTFNISRY
jgi:hypothetical protein